MAALRGDEFVVQTDLGSGFVSILSARSNGFTRSREIVDVTTKGSDQDRELLTGGGTISRSITLEGVLEEDDFYETLDTRMENGSLDTYRVIHLTTGFQYEGSFQVESIEFAGVHNDTVTYSITLQSSGAVTKTDTISN